MEGGCTTILVFLLVLAGQAGERPKREVKVSGEWTRSGGREGARAVLLRLSQQYMQLGLERVAACTGRDCFLVCHLKLPCLEIELGRLCKTVELEALHFDIRSNWYEQ